MQFISFEVRSHWDILHNVRMFPNPHLTYGMSCLVSWDSRSQLLIWAEIISQFPPFDLIGYNVRITWIIFWNVDLDPPKFFNSNLRIPESRDLFPGLTSWFLHYLGVETPFPHKSQNLCLDLAPIMCLVINHIEEEELYLKCNYYVILRLINFPSDENLCINTIKAGGRRGHTGL